MHHRATIPELALFAEKTGRRVEVVHVQIDFAEERPEISKFQGFRKINIVNDEKGKLTA